MSGPSHRPENRPRGLSTTYRRGCRSRPGKTPHPGFFTFWGLDIINTKTYDDLTFTLSGNTAVHMPDLGRIRPGLEHVSMPQAMGNLPGMTGFATRMMKKQMEEMEIPSIPDFLDLLHASGAHMYACRLSYDMMKLLEADLHPGVEGVISAGDFIDIAEGAQVVFV